MALMFVINLLHVTYYMLHAICYMLHVACYMFDIHERPDGLDIRHEPACILAWKYTHSHAHASKLSNVDFLKRGAFLIAFLQRSGFWQGGSTCTCTYMRVHAGIHTHIYNTYMLHTSINSSMRVCIRTSPRPLRLQFAS